MMNSKDKFINSSKRNPCPICEKPHGCKIGDSLIICLRADQNWSISGWRYIKQARNGMGSLWGISHYEPGKLFQKGENSERKTRERERLTSALTAQQLDREARKILDQLGLSSRHRQSLIERGLTNEQIETLGFKSVSRYQHLLIPINPNFPGISEDGLTLQINGDGFLIPIFNYSGLIIGFQVAFDDKSEGKYKHLTRPHLNNGELPLQFYRGNSNNLDIIEGTLKPLIASKLHNLTVVGTGGVSWHHSPEQLKAIIEEVKPEKIILNPDAGSLLNPQVLRQYRELNRFIEGLGFALLVRDWGQGNQSKTEGFDIDETTSLSSNLIEFEIWAGVEPEEFNPNATITQSEWFKRHKLPQMQAELGETLKRLFGKKLKPYQHLKKAETPTESEEKCFKAKPQQSQSSAIALWKPQPIASLNYTPGELPEFEEWQQLGCPVFLIQPGERLQFYSEAYSKGYQFLKDSTPTGHGKSYDAGRVDLDTFGLSEDDKTRIFYLSPDHRNPTNATIESNFVDLEARHDGLNFDPTRTTALGRKFVVRSQNGEDSDIPSNCPENGTFLAVAELGLHVFGGQESPICQTCPRLSEGCSFLQNRRDVLGNERLIRADINSIPQPSQEDILIVEESDVNVNSVKSISVQLGEIERTAFKLRDREDKRIFKALRPILEKCYRALQRISRDSHKYGISHSEVIASLPTPEELNQTIWELYADDWLNAENPWSEPVWDYEMIDGEVVATHQVGWNPVVPSLQDVKNECYKILGNFGKFINGWQTPEEKQEAIKNNVLPPWLPALIDCLTGNKRINLRIDNSKLTITRLEKRHRKIIQAARFAIALDATQSKEDYALSLGVSPNQILEVREVARPTTNLTIHIIKGLGSCGRQRRETQQDRIKIAVEAISKLHVGEVGLIDHKSAIEFYSDLGLKLGYWHRDTRGSNQFLETEAMVSIGRPCPNLGQMAAEWQCLKGWAIAPDKLYGKYGAWVRRKIDAELIQDVGRLRAHIRPDQKLHAYLLADLDDKTISAIRLAYPTAKVVIEDVYDYAPEAATKGTQTTRGIFEAVWSALKAGAVPTIEQVAEKLAVAKSTVSYTLNDRLGIGFKALKKSLVLLLDAINNKTELLDLDEETLFLAQEYLPNIVKDFESGQIDAADVVAEVLTVAKAYGVQVLTAVPLKTLSKLLGAALTLLPQKIKAELGDFVPITSSSCLDKGIASV